VTPGGREQPDDLGAGPLPDADLATDQNQLGGDETVEGRDGTESEEEHDE